MPQDAINLYKLGCELENLLVGGKINRITMPEKDELHFNIYAKGKNQKLIISASAASPRCHISSVVKDNPIAPPSFCMLLRKYLQNGQIDEISCDEGERIFRFVVSNKNELSDNFSYTLIVELMARQSNIFLVDMQNKIIGVLKQYSLDDAKRGTLAGMKYTLPNQEKINPYSTLATAEKLAEFEGGNFADFILANFSGFGFPTAKELAHFAVGDGFEDISKSDFTALGNDKIADKFTTFLHFDSHACIYFDQNNNVKDFSFCRYETMDMRSEEFNSFNNALDFFYTSKDNAIRINEKTRALKNIIKNAISRYEKKLKNQKKQLEDCSDLDKNRIYGELITSYIYKINQRDEYVVCEDYYNDMKEVKIPLQKQLSPSQNAQNYFKRYSKQKRTFERVSVDVEITESFIQTLKTIAANLARIDDLKDVELVKDDLLSLKIISPKAEKARKNKISKKNYSQKTAKKIISPQRYIVDGIEVYMGKSSLQNDFVSFKIAKGEDVWFHINKYFGAHLVAKAKLEDISDETLVKCAEIAAFYSDAKTSEKAVVDYTLARNLKKPPHGNLGLVIYHTNYSVVVTPNEHAELMV